MDPEVAEIDADATQCAVRVRRAVSTLSRRLRPLLQHDRISMAKLSVIGQLYRNGPTTPTDLAAAEGVKLQSLTRLLSELVAEGWLAREAHESDGRQSVLRLTAAGARRLTTAARSGDTTLAGVLQATLSESERALLLQACPLLERLGEALGGTGVSPSVAATDCAKGRGRRP